MSLAFERQPWMADGACRERLDLADMMFDPARQWQAEDLCNAACPVKKECLAYAMEVEGNAKSADRYGVWGGLGPEARYRLHLERKTTPPIEESSWH